MLLRVMVVLCVFAISRCQAEDVPIQPVVVTEPVQGDSDDPAIWLNPKDVKKSLILGTDKAGLLFVFALNGKIVAQKTGMGRLNNVDVEYGVMLGDQQVDLAIATDRNAGKIFIFELPSLKSLDGGSGLPVFEGEKDQRAMGVGIYKRADGAAFVILSRKSGPVEGYLWQYRLVDKKDRFELTKARAFGAWGGAGEIEAVAVDDFVGTVYYSDEGFGVRKYWADPDQKNANQELGHFGLDGFAEDREGISIYDRGNGEGYILVSDQQANLFRVFTRKGDHTFLKAVTLSTQSSDGSEVTAVAVGERYPKGLFVAMSDDRTFQIYDWRDIEKAIGKD